MNNVVHVPKQSDLEQFIDFLFEGLEGYVYVVSKQPNDPDSWDQGFFEYPAQVPQIIKAIVACAPQEEVYVAPCIYKNKNATKESVKASNVIWLDLDGNAPDEYDIPPSLVIQSSEPGHAHVYWKLDQPLYDTSIIEDFNRRLCHKYGADLSGWDATQVLRPPFTINHKRSGLPVAVVWENSDLSLSFNTAVFDDLAPAPEKTVDYTLWEKIDLPSLNDVIYSHRFGPDFKLVFELTKDQVWDGTTGVRSSKLAQMAYICAEAGLNDREIYVILSHLADRWEKFKHHTPNSRARQLIGIIEYARIKYPNNNYAELDQVFEYSPLSLLQTDIKVEWAIPNMLLQNGVMFLTGDSGIGKSRISLQFMAHLAMGVPFLHYDITTPKKINFFSLEMGDEELKSFIEVMYPVWTQKYPDKIDLLNQNLKLLPFGEILPLNTQHGQDIVVQYLEQDQPDGIFIDSFGAAMLGNLNSQEAVQPLLNFNNKVRKRYKCFMWYLHHHRKPTPGNKSQGNQSDSYGDQYIIASATSAYSVVKSKNGMLRIRNTKNRHAIAEQDFLIKPQAGSFYSDEGFVNEVPDIVDQNSKVKKQLGLITNTDIDNDLTDPNPFK